MRKLRRKFCLGIIVALFVTILVFFNCFSSQESNLDINPSLLNFVPVHQYFNSSLTPEKINASELRPIITIVTAYFNIGNFTKGHTTTFTPNMYTDWMTVFSLIRNPVVAFFDSDDVIRYFRNVRSKLAANLTVIVKTSRHDLWTFSVSDVIKRIYSEKSYPRFYPNTVLAEYSCVMHAKYELMRRAVLENYHQTLYFSWLDVGLFRDLVSSVSGVQSHFVLTTPPAFDTSAVAYGEVHSLSPAAQLSARDVVTLNSVWVCGCYFIGRIDVMRNWTMEYLEAVEQMIRQRWISTDQQVLYWMKVGGSLRTKLQVYKNESGNYFHLGYLSRHVLRNSSGQSADNLI